jgi:endonuclease/exonuclease/phosphatase family metal-dependent hydrolase
MRRMLTSRMMRAAVLLAVALGVSMSVPVGASAHGGTGHPGDRHRSGPVVMTRNLYLGADLTGAVAAQTPQEFAIATTTIWGTVQFTNFPARAEALADEIGSAHPDLIGLQEVTDWVTVGPGAPPGIDFLAILQSALAGRGLHYDVAAVSNNANIGPAPIICDFTTGALCTWGVVLQDRDVILVKHSRVLHWSNPQNGNYATQQYFQPPIPGAAPISFNRGWASIDVCFQGKHFRFVDTHLETEDAPAVQEAQAAEFLAGPGSPKGNVIVTGDFNSAADGSTTSTYALLTSKYRDAWNVHRDGPGLSCCQNETLTNYPSQLATRIDLVLMHGAIASRRAILVGATPFESTPPLWASDHAGVVARLVTG